MRITAARRRSCLLIKKRRTYFAARAVSMAATTSGASGDGAGSKRLRILPSRLIRNLPKFHLMSPGNGECSPASDVEGGGAWGR